MVTQVLADKYWLQFIHYFRNEKCVGCGNDCCFINGLVLVGNNDKLDSLAVMSFYMCN